MTTPRPRTARTLMVAFSAAMMTATMSPFAPHATAAPNEAPEIIPALQEWAGAEGAYQLRDSSRIVVDPALRQVGEQFAADLAAVTGFELAVTDSEPAAGDIRLHLDAGLTDDAQPERFAEEGYALAADETTLTVTAPTQVGVFYGTRTALQGFVQSPGRASFPAGEATDWPDYRVRGFMLDVGRRFFTAEFIRDYIAMMSWYKLNEFQIHLNDNEIFEPAGGWSEAYAGFRLRTDNPEFAGLASEDGSYDRADWQSFEDTAAAHSVRIIPEIDVPAHSLPFIHWKPELGLNGGDSDHLDLTKPATTETIKDVFDEFIPWFEGEEVHFGADEYPRNYADAYRTFFNEMAEHVRSHGKQPRAWGSMSVMHGSSEGYDKDVTVSSWNDGWYGMASALADGYKFINMNDATLYVVPFANYYHGAGLNNQGLYANWLPNRLWDTDTVPAGAPEGAMFAVWNDLVDADYTELDVHGLVRDSFPVIAQKSWRAEAPDRSYAEFADVLDAVGRGPGLGVIEQGPAAPSQGELSSDAHVVASSAKPGHPASALLDGNMFTRWASSTQEADFTIDLGADQTVGRVEAEWAHPAPAAFDVELSNDGETWRTAAQDATGSEVVFTPDSARFVRVSASGSDGGVGAWSAKVFAPKPLTAGAVATASGVEADSFPPSLAIDGNLTTRWSANYVEQPWIQVDLGAVEEFERVDLAWEAASATAYRVEVSADGLDWSEVATRSGMTATARTDVVEFEPVTAQYLRVTVTAKSISPYLSLYELTIPAPEVVPPAPSPSPSPTAEPTQSPSPTAEPTQSPSPTAEPTQSPSPTAEPTQSPSPTASVPARTDVYGTPGLHFVNGRHWWTECEPYSQTFRCTTRIWATSVREVDGAFVGTNGWTFNNLTYLAHMTRQQWSGNPLARTGTWRASDGREWRTECDTPVTGANGCRSYTRSDVVVAKQADGVWTYRWDKVWVLNNMVRFR